MPGWWHERRVLVTGAGGFIGSHLVEALAALGAHVTALAHYNSRADLGLLGEAAGPFEAVTGDLRDLANMQALMQGQEIVFHLGALISIPYSYQYPESVVATNLTGTLNVLLACRAAGVRRLVHTSSSEVYGTARLTPMDERHPLQAQSPYAASKIAADKLAESFYCAYGLPVVTVRPFNTYGPRQSARAVIPTIITQALTAGTVRLGCLDARRDFTFVTDTVAGFLRAAEAPGVEGQTFNLGTGADVSIGELAELVIQAVGRPVHVEIDHDRLRPEHSEVMRLISDNRRARAALDWQPQVSLPAGLLRTIEWTQAHLERFRLGVYEI